MQSERMCARARAGVQWRFALRYGLLALWIGGGLALVLRVGFGVSSSMAALALAPVLLCLLYTSDAADE